MTSTATGEPQPPPDYVPVPDLALGPALNDHGFYVGRVQYGANVWAAVGGYLDAVTAKAAAPVIAQYTGVLAAADVLAFTTSTTFTILQSMRLDLGAGSQVHP